MGSFDLFPTFKVENNIFGHKKPSDDRHGRRAKGRKVFSARIFPNVPDGMAGR